MSKADIKSETDKKHNTFWSKFKEHCDESEQKYNFRIGPTGMPYSRKIYTDFKKPAHITVRGNSDDNYIRCQIRFSEDSNNNINRSEELLLFYFLDKRIEEVKHELQGGSKSLYNGNLEWGKTKADGENTTIHLSLYVKDIFDSGEREYYFNWLAHNAKQFLKTFGEYYKEFKEEK